MKRLLFIVVVSTFFIFGLHAQNSASSLAPVSKSERYEIIKKDGKPVGIFDKVSQKRINLDGSSDAPNMSAAKTKLSVITQKSAKEDVATITLNVVGYLWEPEWSGVQMLIDKDAEIVDYFWDWFFEDDEQFYIHSEYKIPENANYTFDNPNVIVDGTGSVDVPGGVYDFVFFRPFMFFLALLDWAGTDDYAMADDFEFLPGFEYIFTVETVGEVGFATPEDIMLSNIFLPLSSLDLTNQEEVSVVIYNNGVENITGDIELAYKVNGGTEVIEVYSVSELLPGAEITYTFNAKADFSEFGFYTVEARVDYEFDSNPYNNTITGKTKKMALIELPFVDEFDTPSSMLNWSIIDGNDDGYSWMYDDWFLTDADGGKGCLQVLCQSYGANEYLVTDPVVIPDSGIFYLSFYAYALGNDNIKIYYGTTFNVEEMELLEVINPNTSDWDKDSVSVKIDEPGNYFFAFYYNGVYSAGCRGVNLDKVNMTFEPFEEISVKEFNQQPLKLYPNPASSVLNVDAKNMAIDKVVVYNILGKSVYTNSNVNNSTFKLNTSSFAPGIYFISVQTEAGVIHSKFVVQ